jgi:hypothetical protein
MGDSLVLYWDRNDVIHVIDPDAIQHCEGEISPLMMIAAAVINAGYGGVVIDERRLNNGRFLCAVNANLGTHEGQIFASLQNSMGQLPTTKDVLEAIKTAYAESKGVYS